MGTTINLRDLPDGMVRKAKSSAALLGMTLKAFVGYAIEKTIDEIQDRVNQPVADNTGSKNRLTEIHGFQEELNDGFMEVPPLKKATYGDQKRQEPKQVKTHVPIKICR
jgi:hypothetical protein